jgi:hypothetical protein
MTAEEIIASLGLEPHPEGGWYVQTFEDAAGPDGRARSTAIYFLLRADEVSHWHRVDAVETWHWHAGAPLVLEIARPGERQLVELGTDITHGQRPQAIVPAHAWQSARSLGDWTLVSCMVAPGFRFEGFDLAPPGWAPEQD